MERKLALDIETTTEVLGLDEDQRPGLDPAISAVTDIALAYETADERVRKLLLTVADDAIAGWNGQETYLTSGRDARYQPYPIDDTSKALVCVSEAQLLQLLPNVLREIVRNNRIDLVVTWNGGVFDFPFLADRARRMLGDASFGTLLELEADPAVYVKYAPVPGHDGGYRVQVDGNVRHLDLQAPFKPYAEQRGIRHSLKPVAIDAGYTPVEVDREAMHLLPTFERWAYALSDSEVTLGLADDFWTPLRLREHVDRSPALVA